jgi:hypothetical protein
MTSAQCQRYLQKTVKVKKTPVNYMLMLGDWTIQYGTRAEMLHEAGRLRRAILETVMLDLIISKEKV